MYYHYNEFLQILSTKFMFRNSEEFSFKISFSFLKFHLTGYQYFFFFILLFFFFFTVDSIYAPFQSSLILFAQEGYNIKCDVWTDSTRLCYDHQTCA